MINTKGKTIATAVSLFLLFAMAVSLIALPPATAQDTMKTYAVISATPNPVGVGQETLLALGITQQLASASVGWQGITITVDRPDGKTETLGPFKTDATGLTGTVYVPDIAGNYTLQTHFPQQENPADLTRGDFIPKGTVMLASDSDKLTLVVQEEPIEYYKPHALPSEYWTRPIDAQLPEWHTIAGNWLATPPNLFTPYNDDAPETAHILWAKPLTTGGIVGGTLGNPYDEQPGGIHSNEIGDAYEGKFGGRGDTALILNGKLYYELYAGGDMYKETACVDLHTGEELWSRPLENQDGVNVREVPSTFGPPGLFGQLMYWDTYDYHGVYDYLWCAVGSTWYAFDPFNGDWVYTMTDVPSGTRTYGPKGEFLIYSINTHNGYMTMWNSSNIPSLYQSSGYLSMDWARWRPMGKVVNATGPHGVTYDPLGSGLERDPTAWPPYDPPFLPTGLAGYQWNVSIPTGLPGSVRGVFPQDKVVGSDVSRTKVTVWGLSLEPGKEGTLLYNEDWTPPAEVSQGNITLSSGAVSSVDGLYTINSKEDRMRYGFSTDTGKYLWAISEPLGNLDHLMGGFAGESGLIANGIFYSGTVSGEVKAFDVKTGELLWKYDAYDPANEILWSNNWPIAYLFFTGDKAYIGTTEHSPVDPRPRGGPFICLNTTTGDVIWRADGLFRQTVWGGPAVIGDSIIATMDTYDQRVYAIGKGPTDTSVTASPEVSVHGSSVLVKGMVTDISPGTEDYSLRARFPDGVPAVSDANMSDWMLYVYKQFERPADVMGVDVVVSVIDPNNNCYEVGRTTSDSSGMYSVAFTPMVPGKYTVIASFEGSGAYYGSYAQTAINVEEAPNATPEPTSPPASAADLYFLPMSAGMIVAIVVVLALLILLLRKR
jgi:outer membrane protein assembly factor BamB